MFYEHPSFNKDFHDHSTIESALVVLLPTESKRLIAKAVAVLPEVKAALKNGLVIMGWGSTNAYVVEEIMGTTIKHKSDYASGVICDGQLNANHAETKILPFVLRDGKPSEVQAKGEFEEYRPGDVFIKGANAIDPYGNIGIMAGGHKGGSAHDAWFATSARGAIFICPVGLEKLVPSVEEAARKCGLFRFKYSMGVPVSFLTYSMAKVVTEIQAIKVLTNAHAYHVGSGGIAGSEGAVVLSIEGEPDALERAFDLIKSVKGEPPMPRPRKLHAPLAASVGYNPQVLAEFIQRR